MGGLHAVVLGHHVEVEPPLTLTRGPDRQHQHHRQPTGLAFGNLHGPVGAAACSHNEWRGGQRAQGRVHVPSVSRLWGAAGTIKLDQLEVAAASQRFDQPADLGHMPGFAVGKPPHLPGGPAGCVGGGGRRAEGGDTLQRRIMITACLYVAGGQDAAGACAAPVRVLIRGWRWLG